MCVRLIYFLFILLNLDNFFNFIFIYQSVLKVLEDAVKVLEDGGKQIDDVVDRFGDNKQLQSIKKTWDSAYSKLSASLASVTWPSGGNLTLDWVKNLMKTFNWSSNKLSPSEFPKVLSVDTFDALILAGKNILSNEPNCVNVEPADKDVVVVVGDVHGQLHDVLFLLNEAGPPSQDRLFVFNGDYVDRGAWGLETFLILLAWKVSN